MVGGTCKGDLLTVLEAIKSSEVVEKRVQLLIKLGEIELSETSDRLYLIECLTILWEDFTCLDVSQCLLNKAILNVAAKHVESDISGCLGQFLFFGTKASIWCGKHLKMILISTQDSQEEEHSGVFFQLLLDLLSYSAASFSSLAESSVSNDNALMTTIEKFLLEVLSITRDSISNIKKIHSFGLEVPKAFQAVLDAAIKLCKRHLQSINPESNNIENKNQIEGDDVNHAVGITRCTIEKLCELGILAANGGGSLVTILNLSWKGVVNLLQIGKTVLTVKLNVSSIILSLISLANDSLIWTAKEWRATKEKICALEAKRAFLPIKFYLINVARISSQYPCQAFVVYKEIALCALSISTLGVWLSKEPRSKMASEVLTELLEQTSFDILNSLLNSDHLEQDLEFEILGFLFNDQKTLPQEGDNRGGTTIDEIFSGRRESKNGAGLLILGRVTLFLIFLKSSLKLNEDAQLGITRNLQWLMDMLIDKEAYSLVLILPIPLLCGSKQTTELAWQPLVSCISHSLKSFMVTVSSGVVWGEVEAFLFTNFTHPHYLCWEIVMELWCFLIRHGERDFVKDVIDKLLFLFKSVASPELVLVPGSGLRKMAKSICMLLAHCEQSEIDRAYAFVFSPEKCSSSSGMDVALLMEGFPLNLLSDGLKQIALERVVADYLSCIGGFDEKSFRSRGSVAFGPVFALSAALCQVSVSGLDTKTLKFLVAIIQRYRSCTDDLAKDRCCKLIGETLGIISNAKELYDSRAMEEVILELQNLFVSPKTARDVHLHQCKPDLTSFMAGVAHMHVAENDENATISAVWELYHMLLRERHWALVHLAIAAFGYFAGRTPCNQLWRFVPQNAALSYDAESGEEAREERFMSELKAFLERESALLEVGESSDQLRLLAKEGLVLKEELVRRVSDMESEAGKIGEIGEGGQANKRRKLPEGICEGMELLQSGVKVIGDGISRWRKNDFTELPNEFRAHFSRLEEAITCLVSLSNSNS